MMTMTRLFSFTVVFFFIVFHANADCGCGMRCQKYTNELQCARCCTATVRRSVPMDPEPSSDAEENSVQDRLESTRRRSLSELSNILSLLEQKERRTSSRHVRAELHRTRQRLEKYGKIRYGDLVNGEEEQSGHFNEDEKEMYDVLERILQRLVQKHQQSEDIDSRVVEKRSVGSVENAERRLYQLFKF